MTYSDVVDLLEATALEAGAAGFYHGPKQAKGIAYNEAFPQAHLYLMPDVLTEKGVLYSVGMGFFGKDEHESDSPTAVGIQNQMDMLTQRFVRLLREEDEVEVGKQCSRLPVLRNSTLIGTGYYIDFELTISPVC